MLQRPSPSPSPSGGGSGSSGYRPLVAEEERQQQQGAVVLDDALLLGVSHEGLPSAARLLAARPYHAGVLLKKRERCLGLCPPQWPPRLFVLSGRYLYRFASERSRRPKGYPIPVEGADFRPIDDELLPHAFAVCTLSKEMVLAADSAEERRRWLEQLRAAKQRAIKESLGHAQEMADHAPFNKMGSRLWQRKLTWAGRGRGLQAGGGGVEGEERAAGPLLEMRTLGAGGGFVDPHH